jgi:hypothetical protein
MSNLFNPFSFSVLGDSLGGSSVRPSLRVIGPPMSADRTLMARKKFADFCAVSRTAQFGNQVKHGRLADGTPYNITVTGMVAQMQVWGDGAYANGREEEGAGAGSGCGPEPVFNMQPPVTPSLSSAYFYLKYDRIGGEIFAGGNEKYDAYISGYSDPECLEERGGVCFSSITWCSVYGVVDAEGEEIYGPALLSRGSLINSLAGAANDPPTYVASNYPVGGNTDSSLGIDYKERRVHKVTGEESYEPHAIAFDMPPNLLTGSSDDLLFIPGVELDASALFSVSQQYNETVMARYWDELASYQAEYDKFKERHDAWKACMEGK